MKIKAPEDVPENNTDMSDDLSFIGDLFGSPEPYNGLSSGQPGSDEATGFNFGFYNSTQFGAGVPQFQSTSSGPNIQPFASVSAETPNPPLSGKEALREKLTGKRHHTNDPLDIKPELMSPKKSTKNAEQAKRNRERKKQEEQRLKGTISLYQQQISALKRENNERSSRIVNVNIYNEELSAHIRNNDTLRGLLPVSADVPPRIASQAVSGGVCIPIGSSDSSRVALCAECSRRDCATFALPTGGAAFDGAAPVAHATTLSNEAKTEDQIVYTDLLNDDFLAPLEDTDMPSM